MRAVGVRRHEAVGGRAAGPDPRPRPARARRPALRDLRLRPARPRALRRPRRGDARSSTTTSSCGPRRPRCWATSSSGEVRERGRGARREFREGAHVVSFPLVRHGRDAHPIGLSPLAPGGYAEQVLVEQSMSFVVPNGLSPDVAVLTEPMAVALHAVNRVDVSQEGRGDRARLRPGGARGDLLAEGARRADHRRLRSLRRPARTGRALRRGRRGRPDRGVAVRRGGLEST